MITRRCLKRAWNWFDAYGLATARFRTMEVFRFDDVGIRPDRSSANPGLCRVIFQTVHRAAGRLGCGLIVAPFAATMSFGGLEQVSQLYKETCARHGRTCGRLMCSYFIHFADTKPQEDAARARHIRYYKECLIPAFPGDPLKAPPSYRYFIEVVKRLQEVRPEDLTENSVLLGSPAQITATLKKVEAAGFDEVVLYFNVGLKPHPQVKEEMARFMTEVAPAFEGSHQTHSANAPDRFREPGRNAATPNTFQGIRRDLEHQA